MAATVKTLPVGYLRGASTKDYGIARPSYKVINTKVNQSLPFRISLKNVTISAYGPSNPAPIGIAIIGFNNYVL
jgi:hypothetical protein